MVAGILDFLDLDQIKTSVNQILDQISQGLLALVIVKIGFHNLKLMRHVTEFDKIQQGILVTIPVKVGFDNLKLMRQILPNIPIFVLLKPNSPSLKCYWFVLSDLE